MSLLVPAAAGLAVAGLVHAVLNSRLLRTPPTPHDTTTVHESVSVLIPARDEEHRLPALLQSVIAQQHLADLEVLVLDDASRDATAVVVESAAAGDPRIRLIRGVDDPPPGWLGKPWACERLVQQARGTVLVLLDADVILLPHAVASAVQSMRTQGLDLVSPYPRQVALSWPERLMQPLLQWSWLTTLPLRVAERSARPSLAAANGQFLVVDAATLARSGGFDAVRGEVLDDIALLRAVKRNGGRGGVIDGTHLATCRMYDGAGDLVRGWTKSLWSAFGGAAGSMVVHGLLLLAYVVPFVAMVLPWSSMPTRMWGLAGYLAGVTGRIVTGRRTGARTWPDAWAHPASIVMFAGLAALSWRGRLRGTLTWKGRTL